MNKIVNDPIKETIINAMYIVCTEPLNWNINAAIKLPTNRN